MKNFENKKNTGPGIMPMIWLAAFMITSLLTSCEETEKAIQPEGISTLAIEEGKNTPSSIPYSGNLVEVKTEHMNFIMPDEIPSGWNTFRYHNDSHMIHFILIEKMPVYEGQQMTVEDYEEKIAPVFQAAMDLINDGKPGEGFAEFANLPAWSPQVVYTGGVGLISPGETAQTTLKLDPGVYVMECYIKTNGRFHSVDGMVKQFIVTETATSASPPDKVTLNMTLSEAGGIEVEGKLRPGLHTVAVHFKDQAVYGNALGHDVHLVKLENDTDMQELETWMNWSDPKGMETPEPAIFLGGTQEMPAGNTVYITTVLKPGRYAWIAEVPSPSSKGMLHTFTIPQGK